MENNKLLKLNQLVGRAYDCMSFEAFLKLAILELHKLIAYDSGMFYCAISKDCSFFKPYAAGHLEEHYRKEAFSRRAEYLKDKEMEGAGSEALVYKALDYNRGEVVVDSEPRSGFLSSQEQFYVACVRIVYHGQFLGEIYLHRSRQNPDFHEEDMFVLRLLQMHISNVFHIIHTVAAVDYLETGSGQLSKKGMCLLDGDLSLKGGNVAGLEMLKTPTVFGSSILYHVKQLCEDILIEAKQCRALLLRRESWQTNNGRLLAEIVYRGQDNDREHKQFFITLEFEDGGQAIPDYKFKFTKREADIIDGVVQGKNNAQLAEALHVSENTVKTHVRSIYKKVGANNRAELTYILMMT